MNVGRLILPALRWRDDTGFAHEAEMISAALKFGAGGFIFFGGKPEAVRALTVELQERAGRPLLLASDLERGAGQQFPGFTEFPPPGALATLGHSADVIDAATITACEALELGINWVLAPDADLDNEPANPIVQSRSFGSDPLGVGRRVLDWVTACQRAGALACVKHFPGHGRTTRDSHDEVPTVTAGLATLEATDLVPFRYGIQAKVASVMTGHLRVPALDPTGTPATFSAPILEYLRTTLGFDGLIVTDALMMGAAVRDTTSDPSVRALQAGCDALCYPADPETAFDAIETSLEAGLLSEERIEDALRRHGEALLKGVESQRGERQGYVPEIVAVMARETASEMGDRLLAQGLTRGLEPRFTAPLELIIVDDDQGGAWPASPHDCVEQTLRQSGVALGKGGSRVVLAFAEPRASKGRAGFGPVSLEALGKSSDAAAVLVFGHPRLAAEVPGTAPVVVAWHRQRLMQEAAARWIRERLA